MAPHPNWPQPSPGAMWLDGLPPAAAKRTTRLFGQISGQVSVGEARGGPWDGAEVGLPRPRVEGAKGPGSRAHPHRHFGDLCPGRQSQRLAQSTRGTQGNQEPPHLGDPNPLPSPRPNSRSHLPSSARLPASGGLALNQPLRGLEGEKQAGLRPGQPVCNALRGLVTMSPHATLYSGKGKCPPVLLQCESGAMRGETAHPRGTVSDMAGSVAMRCMWTRW